MIAALWKFFVKEPPVEEAPIAIEDDPWFWDFVPGDWSADPNWVAPKPEDLTWAVEHEYDHAKGMLEHERHFVDFTAWKKRKPLPPISALYRPRGLTKREQQAVDILELLEGDLKPTAKLAKKLKEIKKGERRVIFDAKGKMQEVKGA